MVYRRRRIKPHKVGPEHRIQNDIIQALRMHRCSVLRVNAGTVKTQSGSYFRGVEPGTPDLIGFRWRDKQIFFIEVKAPKGRIRPDQIAYHQYLMNRGVIHGIARSVYDAIKIVDDNLVGYGYPGYQQDVKRLDK